MFRRILMIACLLTSSLQSKTIVFDFHGVLVEHSKWAMADFLGKFNCLMYPDDLHARFNAFLETLEPHPTVCYTLEGKTKCLPKIMVEWQKGEKTSQQALAVMQKHMNAQKDFFQSKLEKELMGLVCEAMMPENLSKVIIPVDEMVRLLEEIKRLTDEKGNKLHKIIGLTNWDKESFKLISQEKKFKRLFDCFEKVFVSGEIGMVKPEEAIYKHVLKECKVQAKDCIFIDDQQENINAAKRIGIDTICHKDYQTTRKLLEEKDVLEPKTKKIKKTWYSKEEKAAMQKSADTATALEPKKISQTIETVPAQENQRCQCLHCKKANTKKSIKA